MTAADPRALAYAMQRALAAFAVGALLALAGALMQILLRNPLADPYILGISGGAAVGALAAMLAVRCAQILLVIACLSVMALLRDTAPSARAPLKGPTFQRLASAGTTSMWCRSRMGLPRPAPFSRARTMTLPGAGS